MKKKFFRKCTLYLLMVALVFAPTTAFAQEVREIERDDLFVSVYYATPEEREAEYRRQIMDILEQAGLEDCLVVDNATQQVIVQPVSNGGAIRVRAGEVYDLMNDISNYRTVSSTRRVDVYGYPGGQPAGGVSYPSGGSMSWTPPGGPMSTISVGFGPGWGSVSVSLPIGRRTGITTGYSCDIPASNNYYKMWAKVTYDVTSYTIYQKYWNSTMMEYEWRNVGGGLTKVFFAVALSPKRVTW